MTSRTPSNESGKSGGSTVEADMMMGQRRSSEERVGRETRIFLCQVLVVWVVACIPGNLVFAIIYFYQQDGQSNGDHSTETANQTNLSADNPQELHEHDQIKVMVFATSI